jgi:hypothetical protein
VFVIGKSTQRDEEKRSVGGNGTKPWSWLLKDKGEGIKDENGKDVSVVGRLP